MEERRIGVVFESTYEGNLVEQLRKDQRRLVAMQRWMKSNPLEVHFQVDINGIRAQVAAAQAAALAQVKRGSAGSILGADGRPAAAAVKELNKAKGLLEEISTTRFDKEGKATEFLSQVEQMGNGLQRVSRFVKQASGDFKLLSTSEKDVRTVRELEDGLRGINKQLGQELSGARGRGDKEGQLVALRKQKAEVDALLQQAAVGGLTGSRAYQKAENSQDRLAGKIAGLEGGQETAAVKKSRAERTRQVAGELIAEERLVQSKLKANKLEADQAERIPDRVAREAEMNRIYDERTKLFEKSRAAFRKMDEELQREGRPDLADRAMRRTLGADNQLNQSVLDQSRYQTDSARRGDRDREKDGSANLRADVDAGQKRIREVAAAERSARESAFRQELDDIRTNSQKRIAEINRAEREQKSKAVDKGKTHKIASTAHSLRQSEYGFLAGSYSAVESRARGQGFTQLADNVRGKRLGAEVSATRDMEKFSAATQRSGHTLDFHGAGLLRNTLAVARWGAAVQVVTGLTRSFWSGFDRAVAVERQFATLRAVFRGTEEESQKLKETTLAMAAAQGRSSDEAMDAAIRWSRLGLSRVQVNQAVETSLIAANVAQISSAEAAEKLSAIYATYSLTVSDLPVILNRLNAISNRYNVTNKDLLEGIVRVAGVAKQAGLELTTLEGIIGAVTGATGRPGQEIGNALKFVITRVSDPKAIEKLREQFNIDLRKPNGDLMEFGDILASLAAKFPTLNNAAKASFLSITAGSRQASRMALILDQYRQAQTLSAEAAFDSSSAYAENEKIIQSLEARIQSLASTWTEFFVAMGDAGAYERVGSFLKYLRGLVDDLRDGLPTSSSFGKEMIGINDALTADSVEKFGGGEDLWLGTRSKFKREEVEKALAEMKKLQPSRFKQEIWGYSQSQVDEQVARMEHVLNTGGDTRSADALTEIVGNLGEARERLRGLEESATLFQGIGADIEAGGKGREALIRDFESAASTLLRLTNGQQLYNKVMGDFKKAMESGDRKGAAGAAAEAAAAFTAAVPAASTSLATTRESALASLNAEAAKLEKEKAAALVTDANGDPEKLRERGKLLESIKGQLKAVNEQIRFVNGEVKEAEKAHYPWDNISDVKAFKEELEAIVRVAENARQPAVSLTKGIGDFESIADDLRKGGVSVDELQQKFKNLEATLLGVKGGDALFGSGLDAFMSALDAGDSAGAAGVADGLASNMSLDRIQAAAAANNAYRQTMRDLNAELVDLTRQRQVIGATSAGDDPEQLELKSKAMGELGERIETVSKAMSKLSAEQAKSVSLGFSESQLKKVTSYFNDLVMKGGEIASAFTDAGPDSERDPVERIFQRRIQMAGLLLDSLKEVEIQTRRTAAEELPNAGRRSAEMNARYKNPDPGRSIRQGLGVGDPFNNGRGDGSMLVPVERRSGSLADAAKMPRDGDPFFQSAEEAARLAAFKDHEVEKQKESMTIASLRVRQETEALRIEMEKLRIQEQIATLKRAESEAGRQAASSASAYLVGEDEVRQLLTQTDALLTRADLTINKALGEDNIRDQKGLPSDYASKSRASGAVLQDEMTIRGNLETLEQRRNELVAARRNLEFDTVKAMRQQAEEASKSFQMASREDQLRAATLARTIGNRGIGQNEFSFLSQSARQAVTSYLPDKAPGNLNEPKAEEARRRREIDEQKAAINSVFGTLSGQLDSLQARITAAQSRGGSLDNVPAVPGQPVQQAAGSRDQNPVVNVDVGSVNVQVKISESVAEIVKEYVNAKVDLDLGNLRRELRTRPIPNAQSSVE